MSVVTLRPTLTEADLQGLLRDRPDEERALSAVKLCRRIGVGVLSEEERLAAEQIMMLLAEDAAVSVRKALATTLQNSPNLPPAVAKKLIDDLDEIACPVLEHSPVLSDEDLIAILRAGDMAKQYAIAGRETLHSDVVDVLTEVGAVDSLARAASNDGADFSEGAMVRALERFPKASILADAFVNRSHLPITIVETLVSSVSDMALLRLSRRHALPPSLAVELAEGGRERATIDLLDQAGCAREMTRFVQQLQLNGRLTPSLVIRGVCMGHVRFFEHAVAELAGIAHTAAWMMVHDAGPLGLRAVFDRAGLPRELFPAARVAIDTYHEIQLEGGAADRLRITQRMIERVLTRRHALPEDSVTYLLDKLDAASREVLDADDPLGQAPDASRRPA